MIKIIRQNDYKEGLWRNGQGVSWEIASYKQEDAADFSWRFAKARIDSNVAFSIYNGMDRIFMMLEGGGMNLKFGDGTLLHVHEKWIPHAFSCDLPLFCELIDGPSLDLNLFVDRTKYSVRAEILETFEHLNTQAADIVVLYALSGDLFIGEAKLPTGDAAIVEGRSEAFTGTQGSKLFVGYLTKI